MDLFLSHVEEDSLVVKELRDALEAEGYSTWDYKKDARPVIDHQTQTRQAITEAAAFVLLISPHSLDQPQHVRREVLRAAQLDKPFVPLLLDVPYAEFAAREPTWEDALAGAVAISIPPEGPACVVSAIVESLRRLGIQPSIPTLVCEERLLRATAGEGARDSQAASDIALRYFDRDFLIAMELADALEAEGYSTWYYERDFLRGRGPVASGLDRPDEPRSDVMGEAAAAVKLADLLIHDALRGAATEIHVEPTESEVRIRFRLDGVLTEVMRTPKRVHAGLLSRLKLMANRSLADDAGLPGSRSEVERTSLHITTQPTEYGEQAVVLISDRVAVHAALSQATALLILFRRDASGSPQVPLEGRGESLGWKPLLLVHVGGGEPVVETDPLWSLVPKGSVILEMPEGVSRPFLTALVGTLQGWGLQPRGPRLRIQLVLGDITDQKVDAIVNAANPSLMGGAGVDGAIHHKGGPQILQECKQLRRERYPEGLPTGEAVATTGGRLPASWVIHTVGPVYSNSEECPRLLASCHGNALRVADELGAKSVAFPAISTGAFGYPVELAAPIAIRAVKEARTRVELVRFVAFDRAAYAAFERGLRAAP